MTSLEQFTSAAVADPVLKSRLKAAATDDEFIDLFVKSADACGYNLNSDIVRKQMQTDRATAARMSDTEFESVAGSMLGARLSGGHQSGSNC